MPSRSTFAANARHRLKTKLHDDVVSAILGDPKILNYKIINLGEILYTQRDFPCYFSSGTESSIDIFYAILYGNTCHLVGIEYESTSYGESHAKLQLKNAQKRIETDYRHLLEKIFSGESIPKTTEWHGLFVYCTEDPTSLFPFQGVLDALATEEKYHIHLS